MKAAIAVLITAACSSALHEPSPIASFAPPRADGKSADDLMRAANAAWARRTEPHQAETAQGLYLDAALAAPRRAEPVLGAMRALSYRIEHEPGVAKDQLAAEEVQLGQWCQRRAPAEPECDYRLALALGQEARERPLEGRDALGKMVALLRTTIARSPRLDAAGPHRVLALVFLRAPSWPLGPGDSEAGLREARAAATLVPDAAQNQLVLGEALAKSGDREAARAAYGKALALATAARNAGDLDAEGWMTQAKAGMSAE